MDDQQVLNIAIKQRPIEGKANIELIKFLSKYFKLPRSAFEIKSGQKGRLKTLRIIEDEQQLELLRASLQALMDRA